MNHLNLIYEELKEDDDIVTMEPPGASESPPSSSDDDGVVGDVGEDLTPSSGGNDGNNNDDVCGSLRTAVEMEVARCRKRKLVIMTAWMRSGCFCSIGLVTRLKFKSVTFSWAA